MVHGVGEFWGKVQADMLDTCWKHLTPFLWLSILLLSKDVECPVCGLREAILPPDYDQKGDVIIGGILLLYSSGNSFLPTFTFRPKPSRSTTLVKPNLRHILAFIFAIDEINRRADILPNITLGCTVYDSCARQWHAVQHTLRLISGPGKIVPNYNCYKESKLAGIVGHKMPSTSIAIASVAGLYRYPQLTYGIQSSVPSDKNKFPSLHHTFPSSNSQYRAVIELLKHFGWTWVGIVSSNDESSQWSNLELQEALSQNGICVEFKYIVKDRRDKYENSRMLQLWEVLASSISKVIILNNNLIFPEFLDKIYVEGKISKVLILPFNFPYGVIPLLLLTLNGSLIFHLHKVAIPGLKDFLLSANPKKYPKLRMLVNLWKYEIASQEIVSKTTKNLGALEQFYFDMENFRETFQVYSTVYSLAHALHEKNSHKTNKSEAKSGLSWRPWKLNYYLKNIHFQTLGGEEVFFNEDRKSVKFDILNFVMWPNRTKQTTKVGYYLQNGDRYGVYINNSAILWDPYFTQTPTSVCSESCRPGYHKVPMEVIHRCCYTCAPCIEGEVTNDTDMERCLRCPEDSWSNAGKDNCVPRPTEFLSFDEVLGVCLLIIALLVFFLNWVVVGVFFRHKNTAVVKANNQNVSFILLLSLSLSFLCSLLFIGRPTKMSCLLRQVIFGVIFTISVSSVLAKTVTVILAFSAIKPNWTFKRWIKRHFSISLLILCSSGQFVICVFWLIFSPPFPEQNTQTEVGKIISQCNEGSVTAFYAVIGYMGCLAVLSFFIAFLARKLPDTFNEAQYITFSMLVFCSVWISFIPAYLSTKGKYMVAVEVFSILASSAGLLGCIFIPKCYIILLRPELNTRSKLVTKRKLKRTAT
ncbi:vomeronasal type-2 receptor 26-like [Hyperolius riggenbachi]|uniref:vomeronasal type-2 receptor 26-like n=1 Tax=Hyperolius riggenbachi TaxID=752182 RepID=UPI0035A2E498